jgi:hypothetical protein
VNPNTIERIRVTVEDLAFLRDEWDQDVEDASLRRSSPILRRLLVDGDLQRAWRDLGLDKQPIVRAPSLEATLRRVPLKNVSFAQAGGGIYRGLCVAPNIEISMYLPPEEAQRIFGSPDESPDRDFSLKRFLNGACVVVTGTSISRHTILKYVANKLGGVHLDPSRDPAKDEERKFSLLDDVRSQYVTCDKPSIYFEYLSIGQALLKSPDIARLIGIGSNVLLVNT